MLVIGLTGGIGSGKSTVAKLFASLGIEIIDADLIARNVVTPNSPALAEIITHFGTDIINDDKGLNRSKLRQLIFENEADRKWLEQLLHPLIREKIKEAIQNVQSAYCIVAIPLLLESTPNPLIERILVIDAPEQLQIERSVQRDGCTAEDVQAIMKTQVSRKQRLSAADEVIQNDSDLASLKKQIDELHQLYLQMARSEPN